MNAPPRHHRPARPGAFTLVEMLVSLAVLAVLVVAAGAALTVAGNATGTQATRWLAQANAADAAAQVSDDLTVANTFTERTPTAVTFTVPDRVSLGSPNTVRYAWAGTAGSPLTRQFNGGTAVPILAAADAVGLTYQTRTYGPVADAALNLGTSITVAAYSSYSLTTTAWAAQSFTPVLPTGTASYSITRVQLPLKVNGPADTSVAVRITTADSSGRPTTTVLGTAVVFEPQYSSAVELVDVPFAKLSGLTPGQALCVTVGYLFGPNTVGPIQYQTGITAGLAGSVWSTSSNAGTSWTASSLSACQPFNVFGTVP